MNKVAKLFMYFLLMLIFFIFAWYLIYFYPTIDRMKVLSSHGIDSVGENAEILQKYALHAYEIENESIGELKKIVIKKTFLLELKPRIDNFTLGLVHYYLWQQMMKVHFDDKFIFGIWLECASTKCQEGGLNKLSNAIYKRNLSGLNNNELASLIFFIRDPDKYNIGSTGAEEKIRILLAR